MRKKDERREGKNTKSTANAHGRSWMVINSTREPVVGVGDKHKQADFGKQGAFITSDKGFVREIHNRFGHGEDAPVVIVPLDDPRARGRKNLFGGVDLPKKEEEDGEGGE